MDEPLSIFHQFFELNPDPAFIIAANGCLLRINPAWQAVLGFTPQDLLNHALITFIHPEDSLIFLQHTSSQTGLETSPRFSTRVRSRNGEYKTFEWRLWFDAKANLTYGTARELPNEDQNILSNKERLEWAMEASQIGLWDWELSTGKTFYSPTYFTMLGYLPEEFEGHINTWIELVHPDDRQKAWEANQSCIENQSERFAVEFRMLAKDGSWKWIVGKGKALQRDANGKALRLIGTHTDITDRKKTEEKLLASQQDFKGYFNIGAAGICVTSLDKGWVEVNDHLCQMLGYSREELHDLSWADLTFPDDLDADLELFEETMADKRDTYQLDKRFIRKDGTLVYTTLCVSCRRNPDRSVQYFLAVLIDITERKLAEQDMQESEEKFSRVFQYAPILMTISNPTDGKYLNANEEFLRVSKFSREEVIGKTSVELGWIKPADREKLFNLLMTHGRVETLELTLLAKDKTDVICLYRGELLTVHGETQLLSIAVDITERKKAEEALKTSEASFRSIFEQSRAGYLLSDPQGNLIKVNPAMGDMLGYSPGELEKVNFREITHPDDIAASNAGMVDLISGRRDSFGLEKRYLHKNGSIIWAFLTATMVRDSHGKPIYFISSITNISDLKRVENALRESQERYQMVFENSGTANSMFDTECRLILQNNLSLRRLGGSPGEAIGKTPLELFGPETGKSVFERMKRVLATGTAEVFETSFDLPEGRKWFRSAYQLIQDEGGRTAGVQVISQDITERKEAEEQIKKSLAEKETLLRELYHRTKNNMSVIIALLDLQASRFHDDRLQKEFLEAQNRIRSMALVHQKLYETKNLSQINLKEYILDLAQLLMQSYSISASKVTIKTDMEEVLVLIDTAIPCGLIMNELISNALKYAFPMGQNGEIKIGLHLNSQGKISLSVSDNGIGVHQGYDFRRSGNMGIKNIFILGENQLKGKVVFENNHGVTCLIQFQDSLYQPRI